MAKMTQTEMLTRIDNLERENAKLHKLLNDQLRDLRQFAADKSITQGGIGAGSAFDNFEEQANAIVEYVWPGALEAAKNSDEESPPKD